MTDIELIKSKLNIVDIVKDYIPDLKQAGRNWAAKSPFRNEKTPSFMVNEVLGIFKDFGGDKKGDVITFIQEMESVTFVEALKIAAKRAGIELSNKFEKRENIREQILKQKIIELNNFATEVWHYILLHHKSGKEGLEYCKSRGFDKEIIIKYKIGFAPSNLNLVKLIESKLHWDINSSEVKNVLQLCGLFKEVQNSNINNVSNANNQDINSINNQDINSTNDNAQSNNTANTQSNNINFYDKFRERLMFNIKNNNGEIIAFSGRVINPKDKRPKYINSPETILYKKSEQLFNFYQSKSEIRKQGFVIITEGQIDTIKSVTANIENIVAPLGTALTEEQLKLVSRYSSNIAFSYDNDNAGQTALDKAWEMCNKLNLKTFVIKLPDEIENKKIKDIDDLIRINKNLWKNLVENKKYYLDFIIEQNTQFANNNNILKKRETINRLIQRVAVINDNILKINYLEKIADIFKVDKNDLLKELETESQKINNYPHSKSNIYAESSNIKASELKDSSIDRLIKLRDTEQINTTVLNTKQIYDPKELWLLFVMREYPEFKKSEYFELFETIPIELLKNLKELDLESDVTFALLDPKIAQIPESHHEIELAFDKNIEYLKLKFRQKLQRQEIENLKESDTL